MYINVNFESIEEVKEFVKAFGDVGCNCVNQATVKRTTKSKAKKETKPVEEHKEEVKEVEETKEEVKSYEMPPFQIEETKEEVTINKDDVIKAFKLKMKEGKNAELKNILSSVGASKISEIEEKDYEKVLKEVEAL